MYQVERLSLFFKKPANITIGIKTSGYINITDLRSTARVPMINPIDIPQKFVKYVMK